MTIDFSKLPWGGCSACERDHFGHSSDQPLHGETRAMPLIGDRPELNLNAVIYATDFSCCSQNAGLFSAAMAKYFSSKLLVAHAFTLSQAALEVEMDSVLVSQQRQDL